MRIGSFMGRVFEVSDKRILTPSNLKGSAGADYATHDTAGRKARSQYIAPQLRKYTYDLKLRAQDGISPRNTLDYFRRKMEEGVADWFVIGGEPLSSYPFAIKGISEEWDTIITGGVLVECMVSLTIEEYL